MVKKKIILFNASLHTGGGTERVLVNLANSLDENGYDVVILYNIIGELKLYKLNSTIKVHQYKYGKYRNSYLHKLAFKIFNRLLGSLILNCFLRKFIDCNTISIISFSPAITNECFNTNYWSKVISFEHWPFSSYNKYLKAQEKIKSIYPRIKKVVVLTESEKHIYKSLGCNVCVIPNAYSFFPQTPAELRNKRVLSVGHFNNQKRRDLLINAWKHVNEVNPDWELLIVGNGQQMKESLDLIKLLGLSKSIKIIDPTNNIIEYYKSSSIFVLSSEFEALPLVLIEAKIVGLPCVSFDIVAGPNEIIQDGLDGFLVPYPNTIEMAEKINMLIHNNELRKTFGFEARQDAIKRFSPQKVYTKWKTLLNEMENI